MTQFTAKSLEDIAANFDHFAWQATAFSNRLHKTKRDKLLAECEKETWERAARILRNTTLKAETVEFVSPTHKD